MGRSAEVLYQDVQVDEDYDRVLFGRLEKIEGHCRSDCHSIIGGGFSRISGSLQLPLPVPSRPQCSDAEAPKGLIRRFVLLPLGR